MIQIFQKYFQRVCNKLGTLGGGLLLWSGPFDNSKAEKVNRWMKTLDIGNIIDSLVEVMMGQPFTKPEALEDTVEYLVAIMQI